MGCQPVSARAAAKADDVDDYRPQAKSAKALGLKLEPTMGPVETLVIDSVQLPSEN
jgi:uncharacterized protein (TIGR03435 family)